MEYIISNTSFNKSKQFGYLYFEGPISITNQILTLIEGEVYEYDYNVYQKNSIIKSILESKIPKAVFNLIHYNNTTNVLTIQNDVLGQLPLYISSYKYTFIISNNFWSIIKLLNSRQLSINKIFLKSLIYLHRIPKEGATFIDNINEIKAASYIEIDVLKNKQIKNYIYWDLIHQPDYNLTIDEATFQLDKDIKKQFSIIHSKYSDKLFAFGNSGGLDSRIIPLYAKEFSIPILGYTIGQIKNNLFLKTASFYNAKKIANLLDFNQFDISYYTSNYFNRFLLDIKNNPFGLTQIFKNPYESIPYFDYLICGGNGFIVANDSGKWINFEKINRLTEKKEYLFHYISQINRIGLTSKLSDKLINRLYSSKNINSIIRSRKNEFNNLFLEDEIQEFKYYISEFVDQNQYKDNISLIRTFHQKILNKKSYSGGFESLNRLKKSFYLYYPYSIENTLKWPNDFFYQRRVLINLIQTKYPKLMHIPDQKLQNIDKKKVELLRKVELSLRKTGINYLDWESASLKNLIHSILEENPDSCFYSIFDKKSIYNLMEKNYYSPHIYIGLVKVKKMIDIIYNRDFNLLNNNFKIQ